MILPRSISFALIFTFLLSCVARPAQAQPDSLWSRSTVPANVDEPDANAVELGVKFTSDVNGTISPIRFYKGSKNTRKHAVSLWSSVSKRLATTATSTNETSSGWQTVTLSMAVSITAGTTYVASYPTPGYYADDINYFNAAYSNGGLHAPVGAGVYTYGTSAFHKSVWNNSNYWIDIVFNPASASPPPPPVNGQCGEMNGVTTNVAPMTNLCAVGTASTAAGAGPWSWNCAGSNGGTSAQCEAFAPGATYSSWPNFPQSSTFFPIAVWLANPNRRLGSGAPYPTVATSAAAAKINILLGVDNGGTRWPSGVCSGDSNGYLAAIRDAGLYSIPDVNLSNGTSSNSISSILCLASSLGATANIIGWNMGDEPACGATMTLVPGQVTKLRGYDPTRPLFYNMTDWPFNHGICYRRSQNIFALQAIDVGSFDVYPLISPWNGSLPGVPQDSMWIQGYSVVSFRQNGRLAQPIWAFVETGTDALGHSSQNGNTCNAATNLCTPNNNEYRATNEQVNAEAWMSIINGAVGIAWFCHDSTALALCLGETGSALANSIQANLTYINTTILSFAQQLNSSTVGICTMINGTKFTNFTTSCWNGILTVATGNASIPASAMVKSYNGAHYLFAQPARNGSETLTFTLSGDAGKTATVVYDSNAHYDAPNSSVGNALPLNGLGQFIDRFGANGHNYQVKIYAIQ